jgi:hypothetical protein
MENKKENKKVHLWVRLGGYIEMTPEEALQLSNGQFSDEQIESIIKRGFEVNGDCYAPGDSLDETKMPELGCYDLEFGSLGPFTLKFAGDDAPAK